MKKFFPNCFSKVLVSLKTAFCLLEISINDTGEILYGLSEEGKEEVKRLNNGEDI